MDNNKDRQFYWEVKDFMSKKHEPMQNEKPQSLKDAVKSIVEQNKIYQQSSFNMESGAVDVAKQAINHVHSVENGFTPSSVGYTKNQDRSSFQKLDEAALGGLGRMIRSGLRNVRPQAPAKKFGDYVVPAIGGAAIGGGAMYGGFKLGQTLSTATSEADAMRKKAEEVGGVPQLSPEDQELADMRRKAQDIGGVPQTSEEDKELFAMRKKAEEIGGVPMPSSTTPSTTPTTPTTPTSPAKPLSDKDKYLEARKAYWKRRNTERRGEAEENLARTQFGRPTTAYQAGSMAANRLRQQKAAEGSGDWSDEKIERMAQKETELRFRTPEEREAKKKENESVVASLAKAADEIRAKEANAPKTYRI
jgi:hypothetical protein